MSRRDEERGTAAPLILGFVVVILLLIAAVTDATAAFLDRQSLESLADDAALQGADLGAQGVEVYDGRGVGGRLEQTGVPAQRAVTAYLDGVWASDRFPGITPQVRVDGAERTVIVRLCAQVNLPLGVPGLVRSATVCGTGQAAVTQDR